MVVEIKATAALAERNSLYLKGKDDIPPGLSSFIEGLPKIPLNQFLVNELKDWWARSDKSRSARFDTAYSPEWPRDHLEEAELLVNSSLEVRDRYFGLESQAHLLAVEYLREVSQRSDRLVVDSVNISAASIQSGCRDDEIAKNRAAVQNIHIAENSASEKRYELHLASGSSLNLSERMIELRERLLSNLKELHDRCEAAFVGLRTLLEITEIKEPPKSTDYSIDIVLLHYQWIKAAKRLMQKILQCEATHSIRINLKADDVIPDLLDILGNLEPQSKVDLSIPLTEILKNFPAQRPVGVVNISPEFVALTPKVDANGISKENSWEFGVRSEQRMRRYESQRRCAIAVSIVPPIQKNGEATWRPVVRHFQNTPVSSGPQIGSSIIQVSEKYSSRLSVAGKWIVQVGGTVELGYERKAIREFIGNLNSDLQIVDLAIDVDVVYRDN